MTPEQLKLKIIHSKNTTRWRALYELQTPQSVDIQIQEKQYVSFASNDYLGFANNLLIRQAMIEGVQRFGTGSGSSHFLTGHSVAHRRAEESLAEFFNQPSACLFSSGYSANLGSICALASRHSHIFADRLNHASLNDAMKLSGSKIHRYRHNDMQHLEYLLSLHAKPGSIIVSDSVFSMDGNIAQIKRLYELAERFDSWLYLDDAHAGGVIGHGKGSLAYAGLAHHPRIIQMITLGKAFGLSGAAVLGSKEWIDWLRNKAKTYMYTTAISPAIAWAIPMSINLLKTSPALSRLTDHIHRFNLQLQTSIMVRIVTHDRTAINLHKNLKEYGFWVPAIRPPTVPEQSSRLRISLNADHKRKDIECLLQIIEHTLEKT